MADYSALLVYDVSRLGRFQDPDEAATYELRLRRAGVAVEYCSEQFENDGSMGSSIVKTVKRAMAGEYSRELSVKVFAGQARWMARENPAQNAAYDHVTPVERARAVREAIGNGHAAGPVAEVARQIREPVRREEFVAAAAPTAHITDLGICVHDWDAAPCPKHGACATCDKTMIVKGDAKTVEAARREHVATSAMLDAARVEDADGTYGASRWVEAQQHRLHQLDRILATHANPAIMDGTMVQLGRDGSSSTEVAVRTLR